MPYEPGWLSVVPPVLAIVAAIATRQVIPSLFLGVWAGWTILAGFNPLKGMADALQAIVDVFADAGNTRVVIFSALVGSLIALTQRSGGVAGFVDWMHHLKLGRTRRSAGLVAAVTGVCIFVESSITCLVTGAVARPLTDRVRMAREKLAYLCDSTSAPVCILIPLNAWGAYIMGLLAQEGVQKPVGVLVSAIPLNFYAIFTLIMVFAIVLTGWDFGPMKRAEHRALTEGKLMRDGALPMVAEEVISTDPAPSVVPNKWRMILPILTMILMMPLGLYITGSTAAQDPAAPPGIEGIMAILGAGSGSTSVFWAVLAAIAVSTLQCLAGRVLSLNEVVHQTLRGAGGMVPVAIIMTLAFAIGSTCKALGTGPFVAAQGTALLSGAMVPPMLFLLGCVIAFATGTSWGTFAVMLPIAVPLAESTGVGLPLAIAAVLGGGVFGDHCSPVSDTTVVSSMASACDHIDHVKTQLPYALVAATGATVLYAIAGLFTTA